MATNGILDIQETVEDFRDPDMELGPDDMMEIIKSLQIVGIPQEKHPQVIEAFKEWKQTKNGTVDMFLEEVLQLEPGTITKIKSQQVATGPEDMIQTEEEMTIQPGSGDMLDIMQSVGAPQRAAQGGRIGLQKGMSPTFYGDRSWEEFDEYEGETELGKRYIDEEEAILNKFAERFPNINTENMKLQDMLALLQGEGIFSLRDNGLGLSGLDQSLGMITPESLDRSVQRISRGDTQYGDVPEEILQGGVGQVGAMKHGGRIGYQAGDQVLPMPRPTDEDPRASFFKQMGAMPEQTLLRQHQPMRGQVPEGIMGQRPDPFGGLLGGQEGDIGQGGQPLGEYEHEGAEQPPSWFDRMRTGTYDGSQDHSIDMEMIIDFLKKMGMAITKENIAKAAKALGMAMKFAPGVGGAAGLGLQGLGSLGAPEEIEETETETIGFQGGGEVMDKDEWALMLFQKPYDELTTEQQYELDTFKPGKAEGGVIRQKYGIGSLVKSITGGAKKLLKSAKKILKSDLGKMAMLYLGTAGFANIGAQGWSGAKWAKPFASKGWLRPTQIYGNIGKSLSNLTDKWLPKKVPNVNTEMNTFNKALKDQYLADMKIHGGADAGKYADFMFDKSKNLYEGVGKKVAEKTPFYKNALPWIGGASVLGGLYTQKYPGQEQFDMEKREGEVDDWTKWLASIQPASDITYPYPDYVGAKGGRVGYANGGVLDIEEIDLRDNGGFMPLGKKEKADDVPALLSKNEFVFTADAVKSAGEGDPEVGAERMQNVMKNLEAGGKISEESQGLEGARDMFEISERLSEVV